MTEALPVRGPVPLWSSLAWAIVVESLLFGTFALSSFVMSGGHSHGGFLFSIALFQFPTGLLVFTPLREYMDSLLYGDLWHLVAGAVALFALQVTIFTAWFHFRWNRATWNPA